MNFIEFDSIQSQSESISKLINKMQQLQVGFPVYIYGQKGTGRNSFAQYLIKNTDWLKSAKVIEMTESTEIHINTIYIVSKNDFKMTDFENNINFLYLPELHERKDDLISIAYFQLQVLALMNGKNKYILSEKAKEKILSYTWPGQLPEFETVLENAALKSEKSIIEPEHIGLDDYSKDLEFPLGLKLENVEREYILQTLFFVQQNRTKAADVLGISIRTLRNKLNQYRQEGYL